MVAVLGPMGPVAALALSEQNVTHSDNRKHNLNQTCCTPLRLVTLFLSAPCVRNSSLQIDLTQLVSPVVQLNRAQVCYKVDTGQKFPMQLHNLYSLTCVC